METFSQLLHALADLLWPILAFVALLIFKSELSGLLLRVRKGKLPGGLEFELDQAQKKTQEAIDASADIREQDSEFKHPPVGDVTDVSDQSFMQHVSEILDEAATSPKAALLLLSVEIETQLRQLLAELPAEFKPSTRGIPRMADALATKFGIPQSIRDAIKQFWAVRNKIVHEGRGDEGDILRAIDIGITILGFLRSYPRERHIVVHSPVDVYKDQALVDPFQDVKAVILESIASYDPSGSQTVLRVFPTKREYPVGSAVSWEWSHKQIYGEAWYRDPESGSPKLAWSSSSLFNGRPLEEV